MRDILGDDWDLVVCHPPCTDISLVGARYWKEKQADGRQQAAAEFFMDMINMPPESAYVVVENPRGIMGKLYRKPDQVVEPWWFGDPLKKKTCLWYRAAAYREYESYPSSVPYDGKKRYRIDKLPLLVADNPVEPTRLIVSGGTQSKRWQVNKDGSKINSYEDSQGRARRHILRSVTPAGFARAMATQFGEYIERQRGY